MSTPNQNKCLEIFSTSESLLIPVSDPKWPAIGPCGHKWWRSLPHPKSTAEQPKTTSELWRQEILGTSSQSVPLPERLPGHEPLRSKDLGPFVVANTLTGHLGPYAQFISSSPTKSQEARYFGNEEKGLTQSWLQRDGGATLPQITILPYKRSLIVRNRGEGNTEGQCRSPHLLYTFSHLLVRCSLSYANETRLQASCCQHLHILFTHLGWGEVGEAANVLGLRKPLVSKGKETNL